MLCKILTEMDLQQYKAQYERLLADTDFSALM